MRAIYSFFFLSIISFVSIDLAAEDGCIGGEINVSPKYVDFTSSNTDRRVVGKNIKREIYKSPILSGSSDIGDIDGDGFDDTIFFYDFFELLLTNGMYESAARINLRSGIDGSKIIDLTPPSRCLWENSAQKAAVPSTEMLTECHSRHIFGVTDQDGDGQRDIVQVHTVRPYVSAEQSSDSYILFTTYSTKTGEIIREINYVDKLYFISQVLRYRDINGDRVPEILLLGARYSDEFAEEHGLPRFVPNLTTSYVLVMDGTTLDDFEFIDPYIDSAFIRQHNFFPGAAGGAITTIDDSSIYDHVLIRSGETLDYTYVVNVSFYDSRGNNDPKIVRLPIESHGHALQLISDLDGDGIGEILVNQSLSVSPLASQGVVYGTRSLYEGGEPQPLFTFKVPKSRGRRFMNIAAIPDIDGDGKMDIFANNPKGQFVFSGADGENFYTTNKKIGQYVYDNEFNGYDRNQPLRFIKQEFNPNQTTLYLGVDSRGHGGGGPKNIYPSDDSIGTNLVKIDINCGGSPPANQPPSDPIENSRFYLNIINQQLAQAKRGVRRKPSVSGLSRDQTKKKLRKWRNRKKKILAARNEINDSLGSLMVNTSELSVLNQFPGLSDSNIEGLRNIISQTLRRLKKRKRNRLFDEFVASFAQLKAE